MEWFSTLSLALGTAWTSGINLYATVAVLGMPEEVERSLIMQAMDRTDNNITKSAKLLGLTFRTLQYRLEKFGFKREGAEEDEDT